MNEGQSAAPGQRWVAAASLERVPSGSVIGVELDGHDLALSNIDGNIHCTDNVCTHAYALLSDGWLEGTVLECPLHGGQFDVVTGKALCAPVTEDLAVYKTRTIGNQIEVLIPGKGGLISSRVGESAMRKLHVLVSVLLLAAGHAHAQTYPSKPIRVINPYAAGNTGDLSFRTIAPVLEARLGQRFVLENKPGATGNIGAQDVMRAEPDGYTLLLAPSNNFVINQFIFKSLGYDPLTSFEPITILSDAPSVIVVQPALQVSSLRELQALARSEPGKLNFGSPGAGTPPHLAAEWFAKLADVKLTHIPYRGSPAAIIGLLSNDVQIYFSILSAVEGHLKSDRLKALAVAAPSRLGALPDVPTTGESGFPQLVTGTWWALFAPKGTDRKIVERLATEVRGALADSAVSNRFNEMGMSTGGGRPQDLAARIATEAGSWGTLVQSIGLQPQ